MKDRSKEFRIITEELKELFLLKNEHYGDDYFSGGYSDIERWLSIKRKVARLETYYKNEKISKLPKETLTDTWMDLAIYCIMELMIKRRKKK